ncbi:hypothetical protein ACF9IK_03090 [Kitasatospora hibisci]|uniref:P-loop NTPase n=1 Tax=Kitasatospora hibisci TaxID=3369522 RepID=UPI0037546185
MPDLGSSGGGPGEFRLRRGQAGGGLDQPGERGGRQPVRDEAGRRLAGPNGSPTALLQAERQVVGFHGRGPLLDELVAWCRQDGFGAWLLHGPGGQGKTRLVRELSRRLTEEPKQDGDLDRPPWTVVWLRPTIPTDESSLKRLRETTGPLLVVLDYAETRVDQLALLLGTVRERQVPFKLVLIARTAGHWWKHARTAGGAAADLLRRAPVVELPPLAADEAERTALYRQAAEAFARYLPQVRGCAGPDWRELAAGLPLPDLGRVGFDNVLTLHMTALADLLDQGMADTTGSASADPDDVETRLLVHESQYWRLTLRQGEEEPEYLAFKDALAAATLLGADDHDRADAVLRRVPSRPDLARTLNNLSAQLRAQERSEEALPLVEEVVGLGRELAMAGLEAFRADLGRYLVHLGTCLYELERLEESVPFALEAVELLGPSADLPESATALTTASLLLMLARRPTEGLAAIEAVVAARRRLAELEPVRHGPALVDTLGLFGGHLGRAGRLPEAIAVTEEVVVVRRRRSCATG